MPKVDLKSKFASMNQKVKKARMPSPGEIVDGYFKSDFHQKSVSLQKALNGAEFRKLPDTLYSCRD